jgi:hypothetical protein
MAVPTGHDALVEAALSLAPGRELLITGEDGPQARHLLLEALHAGARSARIMTGQRPTHADAELLADGTRLGRLAEAEALIAAHPCGSAPARAAPYLDTRRPPGWWLALDAEAADLTARLGPVDVIVDGGGLLPRLPDPARCLRNHRRTGAVWLVLGTLLFDPADAGLRAVGIERGARLHADTLDAAAAAALRAHIGAEPPAPALTWFMDLDGLAALLRREGFEVTGWSGAAPSFVLTARAA